MNRSVAFQFYPDKWDSHTAHLSDYAYRVYHRIINWMWQHSDDYCSIKADDAAIAILLAQPCERITNAMQEIQNEHMPLLKVKGDKLISGGLKKEADKQKNRRAKAKQSAKARWDKDLQKKQTQCERIETASPKQCSPSPSPIPSSTTVKKEPLTPYDDMFSSWLLQVTSLPQPRGLDDNRKKALKRIWGQIKGLPEWNKICQSIEESDFLTGREGNWNGCAIDWCLKKDNFKKILEGNYVNKKSSSNTPTPKAEPLAEEYHEELKAYLEKEGTPHKFEEYSQDKNKMPDWMMDRIQG